MTVFDNIQQSLRDSAGVDLQKNRRIPNHWMVIKEETVSGDKNRILVREAVYPDTFSGYSAGKGEQTSGGYMGLGNRNLGVEIEVEDLNTGEYGSDRVWENVSYTRQEEFFHNAISVISRTITSVSAIAAPQERQGSLSQIGLQRNPAEWMVGDVVNVSRPALDGGGATLGYIVRVYPITVDVLWPPDENHPTGWTTEEKKNGLIYAGHKENWRQTANSWLKKEYYAEGEPPEWVKHIVATPKEIEKYTTKSSPIPVSADVWTEARDYRDRLEELLTPYRLTAQDPLTFDDLIENQAIDGFEPYSGYYRRRSRF